MNTFSDLGLADEIVKALNENNITTPTEIQAQAIPVMLAENPDVIGLAQTGTGKTAAFGLPLLQMVDPEFSDVQSVVLSPTRELAQQIANELGNFSKYLDGIKVEVVYGGAPIDKQIRSLRKKAPHILVATPGRLIDLIKRRAVKLNNIEWVVLDEADEMLNMGFKEDIDTILEGTPEEKRTWLFSATMPNEIRKIIKKYMVEPVEIKVSPKNVLNKNIEHRYKMVLRSDKPKALKRLIDYYPDMYGVVFCRTKIETQKLAQELTKDGYAVDALHGDLSQSQRDAVMARFRAGAVKVLLATDVAARGIDVENLTHVVHYALPDDKEYYTHRSGRTARAGKKGVSISLISPEDRRKLELLQSKLGIKMDQAKLPTLQEVAVNRVVSWADKVANFESEKVDDALMEKIIPSFENMSKEEMLEHFVAMELNKLNNKGEQDDLNYTPKKRKKGERLETDRGGRDHFGRERKDRNERRRGKDGKEPGMDTFFINVGSIDKVSKGELLRMVCDVSGLRGKDIGAIRVMKNHAIFDVKEAKSKGLEKKFKGLEFEGRKIRMNKE